MRRRHRINFQRPGMSFKLSDSQKLFRFYRLAGSRAFVSSEQRPLFNAKENSCSKCLLCLFLRVSAEWRPLRFQVIESRIARGVNIYMGISSDRNRCLNIHSTIVPITYYFFFFVKSQLDFLFFQTIRSKRFFFLSLNNVRSVEKNNCDRRFFFLSFFLFFLIIC